VEFCGLHVLYIKEVLSCVYNRTVSDAKMVAVVGMTIS